MSIQMNIAEAPQSKVVAAPSLPPAATYTIPVSALAESFPAASWRRESPAAPASVQPYIPPPPPPPPFAPPVTQQQPGTVVFAVGQTIEQIEREMIVKTMHATHGNRTRAAKLLGISVRTLYTKLRTIAVASKVVCQ